MKRLVAGLTAGLMIFVRVAWAENEATYNASTGILNIPKVAVGHDYYNVEMRQQGHSWDFSVTDVVLSTLTSLENIAAYNANIGSLHIPTVIVGSDNYNVWMTQGQGLSFTLTSAVMESRVNLTSSHALQAKDLWLVRRYGLNGINPYNRFYHAVAYADFDGDGDTDLILSGGDGTTNASPIEVYRNQGGGDLVYDMSLISGPIPALVHPRKALVGDYNGDGKPDVFLIGHGFDQGSFPGESCILLLSSASGLVAQQPYPAVPPYTYTHSGASADIDNDGDIDIFIASNKTPYLLINDGTGNFYNDSSRLPMSIQNKNMFTAELIDLDQDGYVDLLVAGHEQDGMETAIYWGDSSGRYQNSQKTTIPVAQDMGTVLDMDAADLDGDGYLELVVNRTGGNTYPGHFYLGYYIQLLDVGTNRTVTDVTGTNVVGSGGLYASPNDWIDWIRLQDMNADGYVDIIEDDAGIGRVWHNDGTGKFTTAF